MFQYHHQPFNYFANYAVGQPGRDHLQDESQFLKLLDEHKKILFKIANSYCHSTADREDLVQEMVLQLWRSLPL